MFDVSSVSALEFRTGGKILVPVNVVDWREFDSDGLGVGYTNTEMPITLEAYLNFVVGKGDIVIDIISNWFLYNYIGVGYQYNFYPGF